MRGLFNLGTFLGNGSFWAYNYRMYLSIHNFIMKLNVLKNQTISSFPYLNKPIYT